MAIRTISVKGADSVEAALRAKELLAGFEPGFLLFFASSEYDASAPAQALREQFPDCALIGSSSHSEFCNSGYTDHSISILAADRESVEDVCVRVVTDLKAEPDLRGTVAELEGHFGGKDHIFDHFDRYVGIVLFESGAKAEEGFMDRLGDASDVLFVGGTSSTAENGVSRVYADGVSYENAAVLALLRTGKGYDVLKTQSASLYSQRAYQVTKSDMGERILCEFDGRPCGEVYAEALGVPVDQIQNYFVSNPLGVLAGDEIFVRTFNEIQPQGISLHCGIREGTDIHILKTGDIVADTKAALDGAIPYEPAGVVNFNCLYRTFEMRNKDKVEPYCALFGRYPSIGFSTSGEAFLGHINETSTVLVLK